jgi:hypothetical protein
MSGLSNTKAPKLPNKETTSLLFSNCHYFCQLGAIADGGTLNTKNFHHPKIINNKVV